MHRAGCLIIRKTAKGKIRILILRRHDGRWDLAKGRVDSGEAPLQAAFRETREETQLKVRPTKRRISFVITKKPSGRRYYFYLVKVSKVEVSLSAEHTEYRWVKPKKAQKMLARTPHLQQVVKRLAPSS